MQVHPCRLRRVRRGASCTKRASEAFVTWAAHCRQEGGEIQPVSDKWH
jgi:hypothetical protein